MEFPRRLFKFRKDSFFYRVITTIVQRRMYENSLKMNLFSSYVFRIHFSMEFPNHLFKFRKDPLFIEQ